MDRLAFLAQLDKILGEREATRPDGSYATQLFDSGIDRILRKVGEEAGETIIAAKNDDLDDCLNEVADLLFHVMVLLKSKGASIQDVVEILEKRSA